MDHYRLTRGAGLPFPALAVTAADLAIVGGPDLLGMRRYVELADGTVQVPWIDLAADLWDEYTVGLYLTTVAGEGGQLVRYEFPDRHEQWATEIHRARQMLLCATPRGFTTYATLGDALDDAWLARITLVIRASGSGVGTRAQR